MWTLDTRGDVIQWNFITGETNVSFYYPYYGIQGYLKLRICSNGILGKADATVTPGGRESAATWIDKDGNFWLFGGCYSGALP